MISAAFIWEPGTYNTEFLTLNALIEEAAKSIPGFLGVESWTSEDGEEKQRNVLLEQHRQLETAFSSSEAH